MRVDPKMYEPTTYIPTDNYIAAAFIMMITGLIIVLMSFYGCYGAVTESSGCLCFVSYQPLLQGLNLLTYNMSVTVRVCDVVYDSRRDHWSRSRSQQRIRTRGMDSPFRICIFMRLFHF